MIDLSTSGDVAVLIMESGENRLSPELLDAFDTALDSIEKMPSPRALVTVGSGKFFSNGLVQDQWDLHSAEGGRYVSRVGRLYARLLTLPMITVAAVNGHAYGAGAMLALSHDLRVMRSERGYFCLPEANIGLPFSPGMQALIQGRLGPATSHEAMLTSRTYTAEQAFAAGIVHHIADGSRVLSLAIETAAEHTAKDGAVVAEIRSQLQAPAIEGLTRLSS
ncbi:enoyl-CoA hydratase/isomerase family protein [Streptomyces flaveolus]|uniref:enoyl-CoA hydratase/isomerase family protein n=1 Tax=Streptomyces flaveolus TaxID=67297 RepID=UPI00381B5869